MDYTVTCDGTPVGTAFIAPLAGLAHADLRPLPGYAAIRHHALAAGRKLHRRQPWSAVNGDFAEEFARSWGGGRLSIMDATGTELSVASVMLIEPRPRVIVDARPGMARVEASLCTIASDGGGRSRPAA
jgi:hypothetical protein